MSKSVKEVIAEITPEKGTNRFSKKNFNDLLLAMINDTEFSAKVAVAKNHQLAEVKEVFVGKDFRKFLKKVLEKAGMDKADAQVVLDPSFELDNADGLYEFIATSVYEYMDAGNRFALLPREDFGGGSMTIKEKDEKETTSRAHNPKTKEDLGLYKRTTKKHKALVVSSPAPAWLKTRERVGD